MLDGNKLYIFMKSFLVLLIVTPPKLSDTSLAENRFNIKLLLVILNPDNSIKFLFIESTLIPE